MKLKIISGGQTGADIGGLRAAKSCAIETGGCAAKGFKTENGADLSLCDVYNLVDKGYDYVERTKENVRNSDITLIFADNINSAGTKLTIKSCNDYKKSYKVNPPAYVIEELLTKMGKIIDKDVVFVINVAGNRESVAPGVCARTFNVVSHAIHMWIFKNEVKK
jgi:hypothetical protein